MVVIPTQNLECWNNDIARRHIGKSSKEKLFSNTKANYKIK